MNNLEEALVALRKHMAKFPSAHDHEEHETVEAFILAEINRQTEIRDKLSMILLTSSMVCGLHPTKDTSIYWRCRGRMEVAGEALGSPTIRVANFDPLRLWRQIGALE